MDCFSNRFNDGLGPPKCYLDNRIGEKVVLLIRYSLYFIHKNGRQNVHLRLLSHLKVDPKSSVGVSIISGVICNVLFTWC